MRRKGRKMRKRRVRGEMEEPEGKSRRRERGGMTKIWTQKPKTREGVGRESRQTTSGGGQ